MTDVQKLHWIEISQLVGAGLVALGVALEFVGTFVGRPIQQRLQAGFESQIAAANARAAEANQKAEAERLARVQIEQRLAPRGLTAAQTGEIAAAFRTFARGGTWTVLVMALSDTPEVGAFARQITAAIRRSRMKVGVATAIGAGVFTGVGVLPREGVVAARTAAEELVRVLRAAGVSAEVHRPFNSGDDGLPNFVSPEAGPDHLDDPTDTVMRIFVGAK